jgi:sugar phosphate isomerase/epimerase
MRKIALQLYTVRETARKDFVGTLKEVAAIGYDGVELAGYIGDLTAHEMYLICQDLGLTIIGGHINLETLNSPKRLEPILADYVIMGARYMGLAWLPQEQRNASAYHRLAATMERAALICAKNDVTFFHHNHEFEFIKVGINGKCGLDILMESSDPLLVKAELDVYWAKLAGEDPIHWINKLSGRLPVLHIKDMTKDDLRTFEIVGDGVIDFDSIFNAGDQNGVEWYVVEQDQCPKGELISAKSSFQNIIAKGWRK